MNKAAVGRRAWVARIARGGAAAAAAASLAASWTSADAWGRDSGPQAYACQAGPGVPITNGHLYTLDIGTGAMTDLGIPATFGSTLAWDPGANKLYGFNAGVGLGDLTNPPGTLINNPPVAGYQHGLSRDPTTGKYYLIAYVASDSFLYEVDVSTGARKFIGYTFGVSAASLAINSKGDAYATYVGLFRQLYKVDLNTGRLTVVGPLDDGLSGDHVQALCFDSGDTLWMISGGTIGQPARLFTVNTNIGKATFQRFIQVSGWYLGLAILP